MSRRRGVPPAVLIVITILGIAAAVVAIVAINEKGETVATATTADPTASTQPQEGGKIGYLGCSNTHDVIGGYADSGGTRFWPVIGAYQGGTVVEWAAGIGQSNNQLWGAFQQVLSQEPASLFWFQLCGHAEDTDEANYNAAVAVLAEIERLVPGATVYVSPLNGYVAPHVCNLAGADGPARLKALADRLAAEGKAQRGPDLGDLISLGGKPSEGATEQNNQTADTCHPNDAGRAFLAANLRAFPPFSDDGPVAPGGETPTSRRGTGENEDTTTTTS